MKHLHCNSQKCHESHDDSESYHCCEDYCCHCHHHHKPQEFSSQLTDLADEAWMDLLKDKIREHVERLEGAHLDELAKIVAEANKERWKNKMSGEKGCEEFKQRIHDFFRHK